MDPSYAFPYHPPVSISLPFTLKGFRHKHKEVQATPLRKLLVNIFVFFHSPSAYYSLAATSGLVKKTQSQSHDDLIFFPYLFCGSVACVRMAQQQARMNGSRVRLAGQSDLTQRRNPSQLRPSSG